MTKWLWMSWLLMFATTSAVEAQAPAGSAQWRVDSGPVHSVDFNRLYNTARARHLTAAPTGGLFWKSIAAGQGTVIFESCTRPGEVVYGSDRVAIRFGSRFLIATGTSGRGWTTQERELRCQFRLIPSGAGFFPAGSGDKRFAIYNMENNRYLVYKGSLVWREMGGAPGGSVASADFVPVELFFTVGTSGNSTTQATYLTIQNIGNVRSSASQREMQVTIRGQQVDFLVFRPVEPGSTLRNPIRLNGRLSHCEAVPVELDTNSPLKFQVSRGGLPNDSVFANDRRTLFARDLDRPRNHPKIDIPCEPLILH